MRHLLRAVTVVALLLAAPAQARWLRADTPNFILYSEGSEATLRDYATVVEDYDSLLRGLFKVERPPSPNRLTIYLVKNADDLRRYTNLPTAAVGVYSATTGGISAFVVRGAATEGIDGRDVLLHEYAHHFMLQNFPANYPGWYIEGFAEYLMTAKFKPDTIEFGGFNLNRGQWLANGNWLPIGEILNGDPRSFKGERDAMFYAQSWLLVHYVYRDPVRNAAFEAYLKDVLKGTPPDTAFKAAFKVSYAHMADDLHHYYERQMTYTRIKRKSQAAPVAITITTLPPAADSLLLDQARLTLGVDTKFGPPLLAAVRRDAAKLPGDPFAARVAAQAEVEIGDRAAGQAMLDALLAGDGKADAQLLYLRGMSEMLAAEHDAAGMAQHRTQARRFFGRAHKLDPDQFQSLYRYAQTFADGSKLTENTANVMLLAHQLAPQVDAITIDTAAMLAARDRVAEARLLLEPVAHSPHGGSDAERAKAMLDGLPAPAAAPTVAPTAAP